MYPEVDSILFDRPLNKLTRKEAKDHLDWFMSVIPTRMKILELEIKKSDNEFSLVYTRELLNNVGSWLNNVVQYYHLSVEEREAIITRDKLSGLAAELTREMTQTLSIETRYICFDVSIYFGETLRNSIPDLIWKMESRKNYDYQRPVLDMENNKPPNCMPLYPLAVVTTAANRCLEGMGHNLTEFFDYWYDNFIVGPRVFSITKRK